MKDVCLKPQKHILPAYFSVCKTFPRQFVSVAKRSGNVKKTHPVNSSFVFLSVKWSLMSQWHRRYGVDAHPHCLPGIGTPSALHVALHCTVGQGRDYEAMTLTNILVCLLRFWPKVDMLHGCSFQWEAIKYAGHFVGILGGLRWHSSLCLSVCGRTPPPRPPQHGDPTPRTHAGKDRKCI